MEKDLHVALRCPSLFLISTPDEAQRVREMNGHQTKKPKHLFAALFCNGCCLSEALSIGYLSHFPF